MQDRYTGDIGDYIKYALLRALSPSLKLGVAWYLHPDEDHNPDGKYVQYLNDPQRWRHFDPELFDALKRIAASDRSVSAIADSGLIDAKFSAHPLNNGAHHHSVRAKSCKECFSRVQSDLTRCDLVFADPDNGLIDDETVLSSRPAEWLNTRKERHWMLKDHIYVRHAFRQIR